MAITVQGVAKAGEGRGIQQGDRRIARQRRALGEQEIGTGGAALGQFGQLRSSIGHHQGAGIKMGQIGVDQGQRVGGRNAEGIVQGDGGGAAQGCDGGKVVDDVDSGIGDLDLAHARIGGEGGLDGGDGRRRAGDHDGAGVGDGV